MVRSAAAGLVQAATSLSARRISDRTKDRAGERVSASLAVGGGSEMNEESLLRTQTPGNDPEHRPRTPVTALCPCKGQRIITYRRS